MCSLLEYSFVIVGAQYACKQACPALQVDVASQRCHKSTQSLRPVVQWYPFFVFLVHSPGSNGPALKRFPFPPVSLGTSGICGLTG